jgi:hypothetical protein
MCELWFEVRYVHISSCTRAAPGELPTVRWLRWYLTVAAMLRLRLGACTVNQLSTSATVIEDSTNVKQNLPYLMSVGLQA